MDNKINLLAEKIEQVIKKLDQLKQTNLSLQQENDKLRTELSRMQKESEQFRLHEADRTETVRTKLSGILNRLDELEHMAS